MAVSMKGAISLLARSPTALFPIALGLAGLGSAIIIAAQTLDILFAYSIGSGLLIAAAFVLLADIVLYFTKFVRARQAVSEDFSIATRANLLAPGFMAAMLIGGAWSETSSLGWIVWLMASIGHLALLFKFVGRWLVKEFAPADINPTWFLPAAGIMTSALSWPQHGPIEFPLFLLSVGAILWLMLLPIIFRRLVFEPAMAPGLRPTLFILGAPFGLLAGGLHTIVPFIHPGITFALLSVGGFLVLVISFQLRFLIQAGVCLSWWAATFPISVISAGFFQLHNFETSATLYAAVLFLTLAGFTTIIAFLATIRTAWCTCANTISETEHQIKAMMGNPSDSSNL
jgi:tellurite resistance protein